MDIVIKNIDLTIKVCPFKSRRLAFLNAFRQRAMGVMLGDDGRFWVTTLANCATLERMGYQWAD